jgi:hypothetical protein
MNFRQLLAILVVALLATQARAQGSFGDLSPAMQMKHLMMYDGPNYDYGRGGGPSVTGAMNSTLHNHLGHPIFPESFTVRLDVDLGSEDWLIRTVDIHPFAGQYVQDDDLVYPIYDDGIDEFLVPNLDFGVYWYVLVHYRYPPGHPDAGEDAVSPIEVSGFLTMPQTELMILQDIEGEGIGERTVKVYVANYDAGPEYVAHLVYHRQNQDFSWDFEDHTITIDAFVPYITISIPNYLWAPGQQCMTVDLYYSHDVDISPDFTNEHIDGVGPQCFSPEISTTVAENAATELRIFPNPAESIINIEGLEAGTAFEIYDGMGRLVRVVPVSAVRMTEDISDLAPGAYSLKQADRTLRFNKL